MTVLEIAKKLIFKTIFEGEDGGSTELDFDRELELSKHISVRMKDWGQDSIMSGSVGKDKRKVFFSMPLWSGGLIEVDLRKNTWKVHN